MRRVILPISLILGACAPGMPNDAPTRAAMEIANERLMMKSFSTPRPVPPARSNREIERDFMDLAFRLESGQRLTTFTRFEGPVTLRVTGDPPSTLSPDLSRLLMRLRSEAGIDISRVSGGAANITIEAVPRARIREHFPTAACFVVPNITSLSEYRLARVAGATSWTRLKSRETLAIILPADASPQEVRDCLHEELAQALGPVNDLYRLPDSVFNDDNVHSVLTGFDMLILRAYYAPDLQNGMSPGEVAARLPAILSRLNPAGDRIAAQMATPTPPAWSRAIEAALGPGSSATHRRSAAEDALRIAQEAGLQDHRLGFSHFALGRIIQGTDPARAEQQFKAAERIFEQIPGTEPHRALVAAQLAGYEIGRGDGARALSLVSPHLATAERFENAALLATLKMLLAEALDLQGRGSEAQAVRMDSQGWARYGFGSDWAVRARLQQASGLSPLN